MSKGVAIRIEVYVRYESVNDRSVSLEGLLLS